MNFSVCNNAILMVSGRSGVGKTSLVNELTTRWPLLYARPDSYTSRARRVGERESEYRFVNREWILDEFQRGNLANLDDVYGNLYAIAKSSIDAALQRGLSPIKEIHPLNHYKLKRLYPCCVGILVLPDEDKGALDDLGECSRIAEDEKFYSSVEIKDYEIITRSSREVGLDAFVKDSHIAIQSYLAGRNRFPDPGKIDILNAEGYGKVAGRFTTEERPTTANFHDLSKPFFEKAITTTPPRTSCLEVGPGQGWLRKDFHWPPVKYSAVDVAAGMVATLTSDSKDACKATASARAIPFPSAKFDYVFASLGDGYCYPTALAEIRRILKKNGQFYFSAPSGVWSRGLRAPSATDRTRFLLPDGRVAEVFSFTFPLQELVELFTSCGFTVIHAEEICGDRLSALRPISTALRESANKLGFSLNRLPVVNTIAAMRE